MANSSPTVAALVLQIDQVVRNQETLRQLVMDVLKEVLKVNQVQAESNLRFMQLVEGQVQAMAVYRDAGPGTTRAYSEADEARQWREELDSAAGRDAGADDLNG